MANTQIKPEKVTKPFQLLATWLAGLVILEGILVYASMRTYPYPWVNCMFAVSSIIIIPVFLVLLFLMQTKYRPEMQEDKYYSTYLYNQYQKELNKSKPLNIQEIIKKWHIE